MTQETIQLFAQWFFNFTAVGLIAATVITNMIQERRQYRRFSRDHPFCNLRNEAAGGQRVNRSPIILRKNINNGSYKFQIGSNSNK